MNEQQVRVVEESVAVKNKLAQLDYIMQIAIDAHKEAKAMNTSNTNFVRIGNSIINLAQVTDINLCWKGYRDDPNVIVHFSGAGDDAHEVWFGDKDYDVAYKFFSGLAQEVK
jgi:hypothetical protein